MDQVKCYGIVSTLLCLLMVVDASLTQSCGKRKVVNQLIVYGAEAKDGHWPWYAAIFHNKGLSNDFACGGTILNQNTVLTAAHCVRTPNGIIAKNRLTVHVGRNRISVGSSRVQEFETSELIVHPKYSANSIEHDIALIRLSTDITYTDYVQPVCLWNQGDDINAIVGTSGAVVGFGIDETNDASDILREVTIPIVSHITCIESNRDAFAYHLTSNMFCAGNRDGVSACNGDSGGGLYFNYNDTWFIRGIVSFTKPREINDNKCDPNEYTVFTDVAKYLIWIEQHMRGSSRETVLTRPATNDKIRLLPTSTCGPNPYGNRDESSKPILLGYPWMSLVECIDSKSYIASSVCQATLISDRYLITSSECGSHIPKCRQSSVRLGEYGWSTLTDCEQLAGETLCSPPTQTIRIESVITHPGYSQPRYANDIALIRLRDRADTSRSNVKPICLPVTNELRSPKATQYTLTSWDYNYFGPQFIPVLKRSLRELLPLTECQKQYDNSSFNITTHHLCTKFNEEACRHGFWSAPLQLVQQVGGTSRYMLYGILSLERFCFLQSPAVFTNVAGYIDWILANIQE